MNLENEMRSWLKDCFEQEEDHEEIDSCTYDQLVNCINRYFDGGFREFVACQEESGVFV